MLGQSSVAVFTHWLMKNSSSSCLAECFICFSYSYFCFTMVSMPSLPNPSNNCITVPCVERAVCGFLVFCAGPWRFAAAGLFPSHARSAALDGAAS